MLNSPFEWPFRFGQLVITLNALHRLSNAEVIEALHRHKHGDQGDFAEPADSRKRRAMLNGCRMLSAYRASDGTRFWVITEANCSQTKVLLPEDF